MERKKRGERSGERKRERRGTERGRERERRGEYENREGKEKSLKNSCAKIVCLNECEHSVSALKIREGLILWTIMVLVITQNHTFTMQFFVVYNYFL